MTSYFICPVCSRPSLDPIRCVGCSENLGECECEVGKMLAGERRWRCVTCEEDAQAEYAGECRAETREDR